VLIQVSCVQSAKWPAYIACVNGRRHIRNLCFWGGDKLLNALGNCCGHFNTSPAPPTLPHVFIQNGEFKMTVSVVKDVIFSASICLCGTYVYQWCSQYCKLRVNLRRYVSRFHTDFTNSGHGLSRGFVHLMICPTSYLFKDIKDGFMYRRLKVKQTFTLRHFFTMTNKYIIISQIITLLHVSTLSCHPQDACNHHVC